MMWILLGSAAAVFFYYLDRRVVMAGHLVEIRREYARQIEDLNEEMREEREKLIAAVDARRAERIEAEAEMCAWLLNWRDKTNDQIKQIETALEEFRDIAGMIGGEDVN